MNFTPEVTPQEDAPATVKPWEWKGLLRRARLDFTTKAIGRAVADYADKDTGEDIFPGVNHLVVDTGASRATIKRALKKLRELGLIRMTKLGNHRRGQADTYALAIPEDAESRGLVVLTPDEYKAAVRAEAGHESGLTVSPDDDDRGSHRALIDPIGAHCEPPPTNNPYLPTKSHPTDELALTPELTTAREEKIMKPEEVDAMAEETGLRGPALARAALEAAGRPWVAPDAQRRWGRGLPGLPPVPGDNGLARLREAVDGKVEVGPACQEE